MDFHCWRCKCDLWRGEGWRWLSGLIRRCVDYHDIVRYFSHVFSSAYAKPFPLLERAWESRCTSSFKTWFSRNQLHLRCQSGEVFVALGKRSIIWIQNTANTSLGSHGYFEHEYSSTKPQFFCNYHAVSMMVFNHVFTIESCRIYSFSLFLPTIISSLGYQNVKAQLFTVPPNIAGFFAVICATFLSDRIKARGPVMLVCCSLAIIGYIILLVPARPAVHYGG